MTSFLCRMRPLILGVAVGAGLLYCQAAAPARPNIILIVTDDQDVLLGGGLEYMPQLRQHVREKGMTFDAAFANTPVCCPSRSSILTGKYIHNTGVVNNSIDGNCAGAAWRDGPEKTNIGWRLQNGTGGDSGGGYRTGFFGKFLNLYGFDVLPEKLSHVPPGWNRWVGMQCVGTLYNYTISIDGVPEVHGDCYQKDYLTNLLANHSADFIADSVKAGQPFFAMITPTAPHEPADPAPQYAQLLPDIKAPRLPSYDVTKLEGAKRSWLVEAMVAEGPMSRGRVYHADLLYRRRCLSLMSVDDLVGRLVDTLEGLHGLQDTYFIYTSDHGFHLGEFGAVMDKRLPYETDIRIPFFVRGPGVQKNVSVPGGQGFATLIDLAPTILDMAGLATHSTDMDGRSLLYLLHGKPAPDPPRRDFLVEYHGEDSPPSCPRYNTTGNTYKGADSLVRGPGTFATPPFYEDSSLQACFLIDARNNTYACVRTVDAYENTIFCRFEDANRTVEFYDLAADPYNLVNRADALRPHELQARDRRLQHLKGCRTDRQCAGNDGAATALRETEVEEVVISQEAGDPQRLRLYRGHHAHQ